MNENIAKLNPGTLSHISPTRFDDLIATLNVDFVRLTECLVSPGWRLNLGGTAAPGIHYNLMGYGRMVLEGHPSIDLLPHTLVITPPNQYFYIEVPAKEPSNQRIKTVEGRWKPFPAEAIRRFVAGPDGPQLMLICGYFQASYSASINLFSTLNAPIVEQFDSAHHIDHTLQMALNELIGQEMGRGAMTATLLKLVLIALLRRSLTSIDLWAERFSLLGDINIAKAFSHMAAHPGAAHSIQSLSHTACLSRSAFIARFTKLLGKPPMTLLRELRMRQAAAMLNVDELSVEQIAGFVGYNSRSSFLRAFHTEFGVYPSEYRVNRVKE